jgi:hypothetical protein
MQLKIHPVSSIDRRADFIDLCEGRFNAVTEKEEVPIFVFIKPPLQSPAPVWPGWSAQQFHQMLRGVFTRSSAENGINDIV